MIKAKGMTAAVGVVALLAVFAFVDPAAYAATVPSAPTGLIAVPGNGSAVLTWSAGADGGSAIKGYNVYKGTKSGHENYGAPVNGSILIATTTATVTGLTNGATYYFTVEAVNALGSSVASLQVWAIPGGTVPGPPTAVTATAGNQSATVTWAAPLNPGGSAITRYVVTAFDSTTSSRGGQVCTWTTGALSCDVTGLTNGDSYTFTVTATNSLGNSVASNASNTVVSGLSVPSAPTGPIAVPGNTTVSLAWTAPFNGGSAIKGYNLYEGTKSGHENYGAPVNGSILIATTTTTVTGLTNGATYYFTVEAVNALGSSVASLEVWAIPGGTVPGPPTAVTATAGYQSATVTWAAPLNPGGSAITRYVVTAFDSTTSSRGGQVCTWTTGALSCDVTGLTNGDAYTFTVTATNSLGNSVASNPSSTVVPDVGVPFAPTGLIAVPGNATVSLAWTAPFNGGSAIKGYNIYEGTTTAHENYGAPVNGSILIATTTTTVTGLTNGATYYFTVEAVNALGSSVASLEVWAIPGVTVASAPQSVDANAGTNGTALLSWGAPLSSGGSAISGYAVTPYVGATAQTAKIFKNTATTEILTNLRPGTAYSFSAAAINASGTGTPSALSNMVTVPMADTSLALVLSVAKVTYGNERVERFSATVSANYPGPTPTGTVSVKESTTTLCAITLSSAKGSCTLGSTKLLARTYTVYATYSRNTSFVGSTSPKRSLVVAKSTTKTTLKLSETRATYGNEQRDRLSVSVFPQYSGAMPTGPVTLSGLACHITLSSGKGSCTLSSKRFAIGSRHLVATYWGSAGFKGSASASTVLTVVK